MLDRSVVLLTAALLMGSVAIPIAGQRGTGVPVTIGGDEPTEGCAGTSTVSVRSGTLNLRSGPGTGYAVVARLAAGQSVSVCERRPNGWVGVVVNRNVPGARDCGLSDAGPRRKAYGGPCESGWVLQKYLRLRAG